MRKIVLVLAGILLLGNVVAAQEIKPEKLFSLDGSLWKVLGYTDFLGFYDGQTYHCPTFDECYKDPTGYYVDLFIFSFFVMRSQSQVVGMDGRLFPFIGVGSMTMCGNDFCTTAPLMKIRNRWKPQ